MIPSSSHSSVDRSARRGPTPLPASDRRDHCVSVRLNGRELDQLDTRRGQFQRGEWLRMAALDELPPTIPALNREAWVELSRVAANLNQAQVSITRGDAHSIDPKLLEHLLKQVYGLRHDLLGIKL